jgi:hypothetical protein
MIRAEFTKLRTVRGWVLGLAGAVLATVLLGLAVAAGSHSSCSDGPVEVPCPRPPIGPEGGAVEDHFPFAHRDLAGDGSLTVRVAEMTGIITYPPPDHDEIVPGMVPWAKAGIMVKDGLTPGSPYAAVLLTAAHGVRWQHNYTHDQAGPAAASWLRLTRTGDTVTGYSSTDGTTWTEVGATRLSGLPATVRIGLFVASPPDVTSKANARGGSIVQARFTQATAVFDQVGPAGGWRYDEVGDDGAGTDWEKFHRAPGLREAGGRLTLTGSGDIAPAGVAGGGTIEHTLAGMILALVLVIVVAVLFVTAEYRRGLIRTTLLAEPRRYRMLAAKAVVIGAATFAAGLVAAAVTVPWAVRLKTDGGNFVQPAGFATDLRVVVGSAALLSLTAVLAYALGAVLRRGLLAVAAAVALTVLPYLLATASVLPAGAAQWLLRLTPAAGFAIQQTLPAYAQVSVPYLPADGYFPLAPWAGLAVLAAWAFAVLGLAAARLRRGDA